MQAGMMELADVTDSKSVGVKSVWVQVPLPALNTAPFSLHSKENGAVAFIFF